MARPAGFARRDASVGRPPAEQARELAGLFIDAPAAEAWAALNSQPVAALVRPPSPDDDQVPVIDFESVRADQDLDAIASAFALDDDNSSSD